MIRRATTVVSACALITALPAMANADTPAIAAHGSVEQAYATGLAAGQRVSLINRHGETIERQRTDSLGGILFRNVPPGSGYRMRVRRGAESAKFTVMTTRSAPPDPSIYKQTIPTSGYGYLTTRDGTKLAIDVHLPAGPGPYPTMVEYSGYGYADPAGPESSIEPIATALGFAVVDVNMRGTGCSGGAFDYFEPLQGLDGYDVIETVARQPWVLNHKAGMIGVSYGGISQLFVAETDPPDLAAIAPLSVIDSTATTLYPGGILNTGFALIWAEQRVHDAMPASPTGGQPWAYQRIQSGDQTCKANQVLHGEAVDLIAKTHRNSYYNPAVADPIDPITFVHKIDVPVYMACQWTDEQTGGHCADLAEHFTGTAHKWFTFTNGVHADSLDPDTFVRWFDFLELYVARVAPHLTDAQRAIAPILYNALMGVHGVALPTDPIESESTYQAALAAFQLLPPVRILFDNGAGGSAPGVPLPGFEQSFSQYPLPGTQAKAWYLGPEGTLAGFPSPSPGMDEFTWNPRALPATNFTGNTSGGTNGLWNATPLYQWGQNPAGTALSYVSGPLASNTVVVGGGSVQVWIKASAPSIDLQATLSEVRPDGKETFVQDGWLRASERKLAPGSTPLAPLPTFRRADAAPLPKGKWTEVTVPLYFEGHAYRAGSRIRITIAAPNGQQPIWSFANTSPRGTATVQLAFSAQMPSRLVLPVVPGIPVPTGLPPCPGLRGEPCRTYQPFVNRGD
jgi:predicted acyl esterase